MLTYDDMRIWCKWHGLVVNRLKVLYWITGERGRLSQKGVEYRVQWLDETIAEYKAYDCESVRTAFERLDAVQNFAWKCRLLGLASFRPE